MCWRCIEVQQRELHERRWMMKKTLRQVVERESEGVLDR